MFLRIKSAVIFTLISFVCACTFSAQISKEAIGHWEGTANSGGKTFQINFDFSKDKCLFDVPILGLYAQPFKKYNFNSSDFNLQIEGKELLNISGTLENNILTGKADDETNMTFNLKKRDTIPDFYNEEEVSYNSGGTKISGTLIKPKSPPPYAVVVLIHGSAPEGKMTRDRNKNRAMLFAKSGIAALIYDRRGNGKSEGERDRILKMELLAKDAAAGAEYLSTRNDIQKDGIGFYGISQGGWAAPYAANLFSKTAFIIAVSAPGVTPDEQDIFSTANIIDKTIKKQQSELKIPGIENFAQTDSISESKILNEVYGKEEMVPGFSRFNPLTYWEKIKFPVLLIYGENDMLVPVNKSIALIKESLEKSRNTEYTFKIFKGADHEIKMQEKIQGYKMMAPGYEDFILSWVNENVKK